MTEKKLSECEVSGTCEHSAEQTADLDWFEYGRHLVMAIKQTTRNEAQAAVELIHYGTSREERTDDLTLKYHVTFALLTQLLDDGLSGDDVVSCVRDLTTGLYHMVSTQQRSKAIEETIDAVVLDVLENIALQNVDWTATARPVTATDLQIVTGVREESGEDDTTDR